MFAKGIGSNCDVLSQSYFSIKSLLNCRLKASLIKLFLVISEKNFKMEKTGIQINRILKGIMLLPLESKV